VKVQHVAPEARRGIRRIGMETQRGEILTVDAVESRSGDWL